MDKNAAQAPKKVIFTCLGPELKFTAKDGTQYEDGQVAELCNEDYISAITSNYAQDWDLDLEIRTKRLVESAKSTRARILAKVSKTRK